MLAVADVRIMQELAASCDFIRIEHSLWTRSTLVGKKGADALTKIKIGIF